MHKDLETAHYAKTIYNNWVDAMVCPKNDVQRVLELYHPNAVLIPTFSPTICTTEEQRHAYFKNLISLPTLSISTEELISKECNKVIVISGLYTFSYLAVDRQVTVPARFSFVYKNFDGRWLIVSHHSSVLPIQAISF
jgi:hypothetical protein